MADAENTNTTENTDGGANPSANAGPKPNTTAAPIAEQVRRAALPLTGSPKDFDPLLEMIGDARYVLIGEASHGTHEFYATRAAITRRLIAEKGFTAVCAEADWPDAYQINRYVRGRAGDGGTALESLSAFARFPLWMWRNADVLNFVGWLRQYNDDLPVDAPRAGFYGLDLYSLYTSMDAVITYLEQIDPEAAGRARERYGCFEQFGRDAQTYGMLTGYYHGESCEDQAVNQLVELRQQATEYMRGGLLAEDEYFYAEMNAKIAIDAEEYYRAMFRGRVNTWNLRDRHMVDTLDALVAHLDKTANGAGATKVIVWAHNSHVGDARATEMGYNGELNVGQLVRERHGEATRIVGFSTYTGTVTGADDWDQPPKRKTVRPGMAGSYELAFHLAGVPNFLLLLRDEGGAANGGAANNGAGALAGLREPRLERAIGVIYRPETERYSHYFYSQLPAQFDALIHFDETRAVEPLDRDSVWDRGEIPETYPTGV